MEVIVTILVIVTTTLVFMFPCHFLMPPGKDWPLALILGVFLGNLLLVGRDIVKAIEEK